MSTNGATRDDATAYGVPATTNLGQTVLHCSAEQYPALIEELHAAGYRVCVDICAVDSLTNAQRVLPHEVTPQRFEVVVNLLDMSARRRIRVRAQVPADPLAIATITYVYPGAEAPEREAADLFGITFEGHPDPSRILMPEDWDGHPLRKDYEIGAIPVQFKAVHGR